MAVKGSDMTTPAWWTRSPGAAFLTGARVLAVRRQDIPGDGSVAAILRFAI